MMDLIGLGVSEGPFEFNDTISGAESQYNLRAEAIAAGWDGSGPLIASLTVTAIATSTDRTVPAFKTGSIPHAASLITITMNSGAGFRGAGGAGGNGGDGTDGSGVGGLSGGIAMNFQFDATIVDNAGEISGGGGGGGGAKGASGIGGGGGGGGGYPNGGVGTGGNVGGSDGSVGTTGGGGAGGAGGSGGGTGGTGGNVAAAGAAGTGGTGSGTQGSGGTAGSAIEKNGNTVTLSIGSATINGDINA